MGDRYFKFPDHLNQGLTLFLGAEPVCVSFTRTFPKAPNRAPNMEHLQGTSDKGAWEAIRLSRMRYFSRSRPALSVPLRDIVSLTKQGNAKNPRRKKRTLSENTVKVCLPPATWRGDCQTLHLISALTPRLSALTWWRDNVLSLLLKREKKKNNRMYLGTLYFPCGLPIWPPEPPSLISDY